MISLSPRFIVLLSLCLAGLASPTGSAPASQSGSNDLINGIVLPKDHHQIRADPRPEESNPINDYDIKFDTPTEKKPSTSRSEDNKNPKHHIGVQGHLPAHTPRNEDGAHEHGHHPQKDSGVKVGIPTKKTGHFASRNEDNKHPNHHVEVKGHVPAHTPRNEDGAHEHGYHPQKDSGVKVDVPTENKDHHVASRNEDNKHPNHHVEVKGHVPSHTPRNEDGHHGEHGHLPDVGSKVHKVEKERSRRDLANPNIKADLPLGDKWEPTVGMNRRQD